MDWGTAMKAERMVPVTNVQPNNLNIPGSNLADTYKSLMILWQECWINVLIVRR